MAAKPKVDAASATPAPAAAKAIIERWDDGKNWTDDELSSRERKALKSHDERAAQHTAAITALTKARDATIEAAQREISKAREEHDSTVRAADEEHLDLSRLALERSRSIAIGELVKVLRSWRLEPTRADTAKILEVWRAADTEARHASGLPVHDNVIAFAMCEVAIETDPNAVLAFASPGAWSSPVLNIGWASQAATKALAVGEVLAVNEALQHLELVCAKVAANPSGRLGDIDHARERWSVLTLRHIRELEDYGRHFEDTRQKNLMAAHRPPRVRHPTDHDGRIIVTSELQRRIVAAIAEGKAQEDVLAEAYRENAENPAGVVAFTHSRL